MIHKHLVPLLAMAKRHTKRPRVGIRSTMPGVTQPASVANSQGQTVIPEENAGKVNNIFCFSALADKQTGTMYPDTTDALPVRLLGSHQYYFVA